MSEASLPACGLRRTVFPLPGKETLVPAGALVYFHNHSDQGPPLVQLPEAARHNRWTFHKDGHLIENLAWVDTLVELPKEGFYQLGQALWIGGGQQLPEGLLVQLGYTKTGQPAAFPGVLVDGGTIRFQRRGALLTDLQVDTLQRSDFKLMALAPTAPDADAAATVDATELDELAIEDDAG